MAEWSYFNKFEELNGEYLPDMGEGDNMATQIVTAVNKLVYKWYNDGDVYDNTYSMSGWANDLSSYANWLYQYTDDSSVKAILDSISYCTNDTDYEDLLVKLADKLLNVELLEEYKVKPKEDSIYTCPGPFVYEEYSEEDDEEFYDEYDEEEDC